MSSSVFVKPSKVRGGPWSLSARRVGGFYRSVIVLKGRWPDFGFRANRRWP
jgi:hypothetical protein